mmetsp:Transcript_137133/g.356301  ORF Transcript_137133/g.356301 Transcript_137133/m.356301 type:complete len:82 (+) Transcript_137133:381-626(+)
MMFHWLSNLSTKTWTVRPLMYLLVGTALDVLGVECRCVRGRSSELLRSSAYLQSERALLLLRLIHIARSAVLFERETLCAL